jgi:hypothetical protein
MKASAVRMLPIVGHERKRWFLDERLKELRNVKNPHEFVRLNEFEIEHFRKKVRSRKGVMKEMMPARSE